MNKTQTPFYRTTNEIYIAQNSSPEPPNGTPEFLPDSVTNFDLTLS